MYYSPIASQERADKIRAQYLEGTPVKQIAKNFNLKNYNQIYYYLNKYGGFTPADKATHVLKMAEYFEKMKGERYGS